MSSYVRGSPAGHPVPIGLWCQPCWQEFAFRGFTAPPSTPGSTSIPSALPCDWTWSKSCGFCSRARPGAGCVAVPVNLQAGCRALQALIERAVSVAGGGSAVPADQVEWLKSQARGLEPLFRKANRACKVGSNASLSDLGGFGNCQTSRWTFLLSWFLLPLPRLRLSTHPML